MELHVNLLTLYYSYISRISLLFSVTVIVFIIGLICLFRYDATVKFVVSIIDCFDPVFNHINFS